MISKTLIQRRGSRPSAPRKTLAGFLLVLSAAGLSAADWPQFLGPNRDGSSDGPALAASWPKEGPVQVWKKSVGQGFSGPVATQRKVILFHRLGNNEVMECLDAATGTSHWTFSYPTGYNDDFGFDEGPRATPAIAGGKVYTFGAEGMLHCLDLDSGRKVWSVDTKKEFETPKGFFGVACSPLVEGDALLMNLGGRAGAGIVAFHKNTGAVLWKATDHEASYSSPVGASIRGKRSVFFLDRQGLTVLDPASGRLQLEFPWRPPINASVNAATPLVIDDQIFLSTSYGRGAVLLRWTEGGPQKVWSGDDILSNHYATSLHHGGFLYGFDGRQEHGCTLRCVELKTGKVRWSQEGLGAGTLLLAGERLLILTEKGLLLSAPAIPDGFQPATRAQVLPFGVRAYPALADGFLYARSKETLVCLDLRPKK